MRRAVLTRVVVMVSLAVPLGVSLAGQSSPRKPAPKKPAAAKTEPASRLPPPTDIRIRTRFTSGAQVSENTTYLKGARQRVEFPGIVSIEQCDLGRTLLVNPVSKSYQVKPHAETAPATSATPPSESTAAAVQAAATVGRNPAASQPKGGVITYITTLADTGERRQMFGREARHITTTIARQPGTAACDKTAATVEVDGWYIDLPAADRCAVASSQPAPVQAGTGGCADRVESQTRGDAKLGFPLAMTTRTTIGEGDRQETTSSTMEVTEFEQTSLDGALFDVPPGYTEAKSSAELMSGSPSGGDLADALLGSTADGTSSAAPKKSGAIRIGVLEPVDKSSHSLATRELRQELATDFHKAPFEALTLQGSSPAGAQADAARMQCDYILATSISDIKTSRPGRVGGLLKKVSRDGPPSDVHEVDLEYRLYPVGAAAGQPAVTDTVRTTSGGGFDLHSALHVAMFAGSMYLRFTGLGMLSPALMGNLGGGLGPLAGAGLVDPRISALSSVTQMFMSSTGRTGPQSAAGPAGTAGTAAESEAVIRETVGTALSNAAKGTIDHLQKEKK